MSFNSIGFIGLFLLIFLTLYYCLNNRLKNICLLIFSLIFYCWKQPVYLGLILVVSFIDYMLCLKIGQGGKKKIWLVLGLILNLGVLFVFKYTDYLIGIINTMAGLRVKTLNLQMPIGISFYTFQSISVLVDCYRSSIEVEKNFMHYLLSITMFPKLVNGPIVRYETLKPQLENRCTNIQTLSEGGQRFIEGLLKKVLLADALGKLASSLMSVSSSALLSNWLYLAAYTLQIYFDFSGYSDMAIGLAKMMGFTFDENFNYPYIADSITDFWRRWHVSLSQFFRDYLYIPLGGNRVSPARHVLNILIVWMATGIWHGTGLNFILWGLYYAILLLMEKYLLKNILNKTPHFIRRIVTIFMVMMGWLLFSVSDMTALLTMLGNLFNFSNPIDDYFVFYLKNYCLELVLGVALCSPSFSRWLNRKHNVVVEILISLLSIVLLLVVFSKLISNSYSPFLYNNF